MRSAKARQVEPKASAALNLAEINPPPLKALSAADLPRSIPLQQLAVRVARAADCDDEETQLVVKLAEGDRLWASLSFRITLGALD